MPSIILAWPPEDDCERSGGSHLLSLPAQSHHRERGRSRDYPGITRLLALFRACVSAAASQADAGTLDAAGCPTPGAGAAGADQLWHGQVLCPNGKGSRV